MAKILEVKAPEVTDKVVLWEVNSAHPNGEVFVVADGKSYDVGLTQRVRTLLAHGRLVEVESVKPAKKEEPGKPGAPWEGYEGLNVDEVMAKLKEVDDGARAAALAYEQAKGARGRKTIIDALVNWNS